MVDAVIVPVRNHYLLVEQINPIDLPDEDFRMAKKFPERIDNVRDFQVARSNFVEQGCEQEKIVATHQTNLYFRVGSQQFLQMQSGIDARKTAAQNDDSLPGRLINRTFI